MGDRGFVTGSTDDDDDAKLIGEVTATGDRGATKKPSILVKLVKSVARRSIFMIARAGWSQRGQDVSLLRTTMILETKA